MTALTAETLALAKAVEAHALDAWRAPAEMDLDGWRVKLSGGFSQRLDSVTPIQRSRDMTGQIRWCERFYNERHMPCVVRLTELYDDDLLEPYLIARGYRAQGQTHVMVADLASAASAPPEQVSFADLPSDDYVGVGMMVDKRAVLHAEALSFTTSHMPVPKTFVEAGNGEGTVAIGCAQAQGPYMGIFSMRTLPQEQRKGHARRVLAALMAWGKAQGAQTAWLQVERANTAAIALYKAVGFTPLYDYRYLVRHEARD
ncbi:MAG: GNAT family N-acetyltransferase [Rhodospirillaceae bacterium]|nr:GNAT family N-acetyltransferase [Rhodospirillaceae bacterium]